MRVVVTGSSGCVGSAVVATLLRDGHEVVGLSRRGLPVDPAGGSDSAPFGAAAGSFRWAALDLADPNQLVLEFRGADAVVHAAGTGALDAPEELLGWLEVAGAENAGRAARHAGVRRFVAFSSTDANLGDAVRHDWSENRSVERAATAFGRIAKLKEETLIGLGTRDFSPVVLRAGQVYGPRAGQLVRRLVAESNRLGALRIVGRGTEFVPTTAAANLARAAVLAIASDAASHGIYHVLDRELSGQALWLARLAVALELPDPTRAGSPTAQRLLARLRMAALGPDDVARRSVSSTLAQRRTRDELGYDPPVSQEDAMVAFERWVRAEGGARAVASRSPVPVDADVAALRHAAA